MLLLLLFIGAAIVQFRERWKITQIKPRPATAAMIAQHAAAAAALRTHDAHERGARGLTIKHTERMKSAWWLS